MYKSWKKDSRHREECIAFDMFPEVHDGDNPLPWRLTLEELKIINERVCKMWWPHYTHKLAKRGTSFFVKSCRCWKSRDKVEILVVLLPTLLRDFVPAVHQALLDIALALRTLEGQVVSAAMSWVLVVLTKELLQTCTKSSSAVLFYWRVVFQCPI